jgi:hypothetical protein
VAVGRGAEHERPTLSDRQAHDAPCRLCNEPAYPQRIEELFGWIKTVGGLRKVKLRGLAKVDWAFTFVAAA